MALYKLCSGYYAIKSTDIIQAIDPANYWVVSGPVQQSAPANKLCDFTVRGYKA